MIEPRPWQRTALRRLARTDVRRPAVVAPTGVGKAVVMAYWAKALKPRRLITLVHRDELVQQTLEKFAMIAPELQCGVVKAERNDVDAQSIVASVQTLAYKNRFNQLMKAGPPEAVIADECHHSRATSWHRILTGFGCFELFGPLTLGVTATPERTDGKALGKVFQKIVYRLSMLQAIQRGYIVPPRGLSVRLTCDFRKLKTSHGEIDDGAAGEMLMRAMAPERIAEAIAEHASDRVILVFCPTVEMSLTVSAECRKRGLKMDHIDANTPMELRREILEKLRLGETNVTNCGILTEGTDIPIVDCIVMARPTKSKIFYVQAIGRGTRLYPGKEECLIIDVVGATHRHDLVSIDKLFTEDVEPTESEARELPEGIQPEEPEARDGSLVAEPVDLFSTRPFTWVKTEFGYVCAVGPAGWVTLCESNGQWSVDRIERQHGVASRTAIQVIPTLGYAQGLAEDYVRKLGMEALAKRDAGWRYAPMSRGQRNLMDAFRMVYHPKWSKGQASDEITRVLATKALREVWSNV